MHRINHTFKRFFVIERNQPDFFQIQTKTLYRFVNFRSEKHQLNVQPKKNLNEENLLVNSGMK